MTPPTTRTHRQLDLPLGAGRRTLRLTLALGERGEPEALVVAEGFGEGADFHRPTWIQAPLTVPASVLPELIAALGTLTGEATR